MALEPDGRQFTLLDWAQSDDVRLQDENGDLWHLNLFTGELTADN